MLNRVLFAIVGLSTIINGFLGASRGGFYSPFFEHYIDFGRYHSVVGAIVMILGGVLVASAFRSKERRE